MSYLHFYKQLESTARTLFPSLGGVEVAWDHLISPLELRLPKDLRVTAEQAIQAFYRVSRRREYQDQLTPDPVGSVPIPHQSVLMAYDFHSNEAGELFLIEINTNASGYLLASVMEMVKLGIKPEDYQPLKLLRESFLSELTAFGHPHSKAPFVAITDEDLRNQKMYPEFLMYRDLFTSWGWRAELVEAKEFTFHDGKLRTPKGEIVDLVYNRATDFYFNNPELSALREAHVARAACVTPNPREYWLLADKERLINLSFDDFWRRLNAPECREAIQKVLLPTYEKSHFSSENEIWDQRKSLFFKPRQSHGGKSVYRGESVSRKVFERLMSEDVVIQRFQPAQKFPTDDPRSVLANWKFDIRFFVYQDKIQLAAARAYQGQVTNFASPLGGFTLVQF